MNYSEDFFKRLKNSAQTLLKDLERYSYSGSYENKLNLKNVMKVISDQDFVITELRKELESKTLK